MSPATTPSLPEEEVRPEFTFKNVMLDIYNGSIDLIINPQCTLVTYPIVICLGSILTKFIISKIPYTEIDFKTYMQQIELINQGEILYDEIYGDTGPIVYPGGFVQIYQLIKNLTNDGDINQAQYIFSYLFTFGIALTCIIYSNIVNLQPWVIYLLLLSKRLISIYVLRLFNDCWTTTAILGVIILLQQASCFNKTNKLITFILCLISADLYSIAISIKMNALLYLPAFIIIVYFLLDENLMKFLITLLIIPLIQLIMGWKFLLPLYNDEMALIIRWSYINQAFNFGRKFLYKWTVNWKFLNESIFLSNEFSNLLLSLHIIILMIFILTRFLNFKIIGKSKFQLIKDIFSFKSTGSLTNSLTDSIKGPQLIFIIMSITNLIGVLFSRSLHYQFLSWYCWSLPGLLFLNFSIFISIPLWILHEWCWNVYPSTQLSSIILIGILSLIVSSTWWNFNHWFPDIKPIESTKKNE